MKIPRNAALSVRLSLLSLGLAAGVLLPSNARAAFGVTNSGGYYTVDNGANLVFRVRQSDAEFTSCKYKGTEYQSQSQSSHIASGLGGSASVSATTISGDYIKITCNGTIGGDAVTQYYIVKEGVDIIYMATYAPTTDIGELRWVGYFTTPITWRSPGMLSRNPSDDAVVIEAGDTYEEPNGQTRSKYMSSEMMKDWDIVGTHGSSFGLYMALGQNRETSSGGPFFRDIQSCDGVIYNYMTSQHHQTEGTRAGLHGPYALMFVNGTSVPTAQPDYSFIWNMGLSGYVTYGNRGAVNGSISGLVLPSGVNGTVGFANASAQYWATNVSTSYSCTGMKPGTYTVTLYQGQLAVRTTSVNVTAGGNATLNLTSAMTQPSTIWKIGNWDGTPHEFRYGNSSTVEGFPYIVAMHPSDVRMTWPATTYTIGSSSTTSFPAYQWKNVNNPTTIKFNLSSGQVAAHTLRIGITDAYAGGRPQVSIGGWSSSPSSSSQPGGRSLTIGTYRGNNTTYTYNIPASAFTSGTNTMTVSIITGTSGTGYLSGSVSYDCLELQN